MSIEKRIELTTLFDIYGELLTQKQQYVFKCYYFDDISLSEIAQMLDITKQAVKDNLSKCEKLLIKYEEALKINFKLEKQQAIIKDEDLIEKMKRIWGK